MVKAALDADWVIGLADNGGEIGADGVIAGRFGRILADAVVVVVVCLMTAAVKLLIQLPSFLGRQLVQVFPFTQAQPLQEPVLLHLQHTIFRSLGITGVHMHVTLNTYTCNIPQN